MKNIATIVSLTCMIANSSYAESILEKWNQQQTLEKNPYTIYTRDKVANFTNHWVGTCISGNGQPEPFALVIKNTANFIRVGEESLDIGVFATRTTSAPTFNSVQHYYLHWSEDGQQLRGDFAMVAKTSPSSSFEIGSGQATLALDRNKLLLKIIPKTEASIECILSATKLEEGKAATEPRS